MLAKYCLLLNETIYSQFEVPYFHHFGLVLLAPSLGFHKFTSNLPSWISTKCLLQDIRGRQPRVQEVNE